MKKLILPLSLVIIAVTTGLLFYFNSNNSNNIPDESEGSLPADTDYSPDHALNDLQDTLVVADIQLEKSMHDRMIEALSEVNSSDRRSSFTEILNQLTKENWREAMEAFREMTTDDSAYSNEWRWFAYRAGEIVGEDAMIYFYDIRDIGICKACIQGWARADVDGAIEWLETAPDVKFRDAAWRSAIQGVAASDPGVAIDLLEQLPSEYRAKYVNDLVSALFQSTSMEEIEQLFSGMVDRAQDNGEAESEYLSKFFTKFATRKLASRGGDIADAAMWLSGHIGQPYVEKNVIYQTVHKFAAHDHRAALEWLDSSFAEHPEKVMGYDTVVNRWTVKEGLDPVTDWLNENLDHLQYDKIARTHVKNVILEGDTETALQFINNIKNEKMKDKLLSKYFSGEKE